MEKENILATLETLTKQPGITGYERETGITELIFSMVSKFGDSTIIDDFGNVISSIHGTTEKTYLFEAHLDEIGFMMDYRDNPQGVLIPLGDVDVKSVRSIDSMEVVYKSSNRKILSYKRVFVCDKDTVQATALDNRVGCTVLIELMKKIRKSKKDISALFVFSKGEETNSSDWTQFPKDIYPIVVDAAYAQPISFGKKDVSVRIPILGKGCAIQHYGVDFVVKKEDRESLYTLAATHNIPVQSEVPPKNKGRTNFSKLRNVSAGNGVVVNVPVRNQHSNIGMTNLNDIESSIRLLSAIISL